MVSVQTGLLSTVNSDRQSSTCVENRKGERNMGRIETDIEKYGGSAESRFTGTMLELVAINLGTWLLSCLTLGIATPWLVCWATRWKTEHTIINGKKMRFEGDGGGLFFEYIKWWLLGVVTLGIYGLWIPVKLEQWIVKRVHFVGVHDRESSFTGGMLGYWGVELATIVLTIVTLGIAYPWLLSWQVSWYKSHTCISGEQLHFDGRGAQLFGKWIQWGVLTLLTLGIYGLWLPIKEQQWIVKHTYTGRRVAPIPEEPGPIERFISWLSGKGPTDDGWSCDYCSRHNSKEARFCRYCGKSKDDEHKKDICPGCRRPRSECICRGPWKRCPDCGRIYDGSRCGCKDAILCAKCGRRPVNVRGGICAECGAWKRPMCSRCGKRPVTSEGELCNTCERNRGFAPPGDL